MFRIIDNRNTSHLIRKAICFLAFGQLLLFTLPSALPMAAAQNALKALTKEEHKKFELVEATIEDIHNAIKTNEITCTELVQQYIHRAKAYNGVCTHLVTEDGAPIPAATGAVRAGSPLEFPTETVPVSEVLPDFDGYVGLPVEFGRMEATVSDPSVEAQFGQIVGIPDAGQVNALATINIRGERSVTCQAGCDAHPSSGALPAECPMVCENFRQYPDASERAAKLDAQYGSNPPLDQLPMYCVPFAIKDPWDTKDMRTTAGGDVNYAMDAPPNDSTIVAELREKGAIIYSKASLAEYHGGPGDPGGAATEASRIFGVDNTSTWAGNACNPYDTRFDPEGSSSGSPASVSANLVVCAICEQTGGSCEDPASRTAVVSLLTTKALISFGGASGSNPYVDRAGINCRTVGDSALVLDALEDQKRGYFDPRDIYTAVPNALIPEEPYANFVVDDKDKDSKPLSGMRIAVVREFMLKPTLNDVAMSDHINNEIKSVLRDKLGAELVESFDPLYPDDSDIPNMEYTFQDAIAEILPPHMPEYFFKTTSSGELEFAVPGHDVTSYDYLLKLTQGLAPLSEDLNLRRIITDFPNALTFKFQMDQYLLQRGDERVKDWASLFANAKWFSDAQRAGAENWLSVDEIRSEGKTERITMRDVGRLVLAKVMLENGIDVLVNPENTLPPAKLGGPSEPTINNRGMSGFSPSPLLGIPSIIVPAGFTQIVYEPRFVLSEDKTDYDSVTGTEKLLLDTPGLPIGIMFWAGPGEEPTLLKVASAYEVATNHRIPPPAFGPLSGEP